MRSLALLLALVSAPGFAAAPHYSAQPAQVQGDSKFVLRGTVWRCTGQSCVGGQGSSRPEIACKLLVRKVGALRSFSSGGAEFTADKLQECNGEAR